MPLSTLAGNRSFSITSGPRHHPFSVFYDMAKSPGPKYDTAVKFAARERLSARRSSPSHSFGTATRDKAAHLYSICTKYE